MELTSKDKVENEILALLVVPRSDKLYDYYINGLQDKRVMLQKKMLQFCVDLCPKYSLEIRKCISEIRPFIIYPKESVFKELSEKDPPKLNRRQILFPMGKLVREDKIDLSKENENIVSSWSKNYSIWEEYNIFIDQEKQKINKNLLKLFR